ncbi:hypothetical protein A3A39_03840 [Candidatus Kaiserbacteria bacterium RIFCSPLOWO2_01_FULL_54_13]|uniref:phosphoribosylglycinamide formyltransferase 1 n=1 Tax=Candidatus Kaiserbacteria bacterium RIFCSPLOWO2_01_FULL_54_13 TaxID=1798512 RepID=A0A1F6F224_9BACT|nr:MAG: hypothetical protein A3A39_03840 [Candidatus Kaiserbacteria bacterium RIFCSPLOWO2_01_FULL_54_13]
MVEGPIRLAFLTSIRDVGGDDRVGQMVATKQGKRYMEGVVEHTLCETHPGGALHGLIKVIAIITDDRPKDLAACGYGVRPERGKHWIFPLDTPCDDLGMPAKWIVENIPSDFRSVSKSDPLRPEAKREFERKVLEFMRQNKIEILVSDHYMARIEFLINEEFGFYGRVLNIHPAVTNPDCPFCFRGPTPTADALARARSGKVTRTGATLHLVNENFDDGPIIELAAPTPVHMLDTPEELRYRNYQMAKLPVFIRGIRKYITETLPRM